MTLSGTCVTFILAQDREDVAETCLILLGVVRTSIQGEIAAGAMPELLGAVVACRMKSISANSESVRVWTSSEPIALIDMAPWDPLELLLFLCECHLRVCISHLFQLNNGWQDVYSKIIVTNAVHKALLDDEINRVGDELKAGLEYTPSSDLLSRIRIPRATTAVAVCFETDEPCHGDSQRVSRRGVRLLERAMLYDSLNVAIESEIESYGLNGELECVFAHADLVESWMKRTIEVDANNTLLLRLDEWAMCCALNAIDVANATGERGSVPQEHRNTPAAWVAQVSKEDQTYRDLMTRTKKNSEHRENAYVCFSGMLEQHFGFEWLTRCFVARLIPTVALRKIREYKKSARARTPPLVIQHAGGRATVISVHGRTECDSPDQALSAWIATVESFESGAFTRKANVRDIVTRMRAQTNFDKQDIPDIISGERIAINS
jgi:hypothetical protein